MVEDPSESAESKELWIRPFDDIDVLTDPNQRSLFEYWQSSRDGAEMPLPERIDPLVFPTAALPYLVVEEYEPETRRFRTRLAGTAHRDATGYEGTNLRTDETPGGRSAGERLAWVVEARQPYWYRGLLTFSARPWTSFSVLGLPFGRPDEPVSRILCVFDFRPD